jgi:hypothetical protein
MIPLLFLNLRKKDFVSYKYRFQLQEYVHIHHIIPLEWRSKANLKGYNVDMGYNLMFMPNKIGKTKINTVRRNHEGGHMKYNKYINERLEHECPFEIRQSVRHCLSNGLEIPWK